MKTRERVETISHLLSTIADALDVKTTDKNQDVYKMIEVAVCGMNREQQENYLEQLINMGLIARLSKFR